MCWNPVNRLVYAAQRYAIYALTPLGDSVVAQVDGYAGDVCAVPFPNKLYAVGGPGLWVIDCSTHTVVDSVAVLTGIMVCDTVKAKVYATGEPAPVFDARADTLVATIPMGRSPERICWNSTNSRVYITDHMDDVVYVVRDTSVGVREHSEKRVAFVPRQASLVGWQSLVARGFVGTLRDASGRDVARLPSGPGSLCELRAGVYFLQPAGQAMACKVVVLR
jgi:hypothetical protein